jgi:class 3 adenylate cyclase
MEQKLAAILAVDVVGEPGPKPAAAGELLTIQYELVDPTISRYGGRTFALMPLTTLVEFAEPAAAVGCGLEIQRGMAERDAELATEAGIGLRIGVDLAEVLTVSGDLQGPAVAIARDLARIAPAGAVMISGRVARRIERHKLRAQSTYRGVHAVDGVARVELVELRPLANPKAQSAWTLRRRWTWVAMIAAIVLLAGASLVLWRPVREWLLPMPTETATGAPIVGGHR